MSSKPPFVSQQYQYLLAHQQGQNTHNHGPSFHSYQQNQYPPIQYQPVPYGPNLYRPVQQEIVFLPAGQQPAYGSPTYQKKMSHDSYAADEPNHLYPSINSYQKPYFAKPLQSQTPQQQKELIHKIEYGDTLEGLSLIYDIPISKIRQRNNIEGDSIYYLKQIVIPNPNATPLQTAKTQQMLIEQFMTYMPFEQKSDKTARFYLNDNDWVMEEAVKAFKADLEWQRKNKLKFNSVPISDKKNILNYTQRELLLKKLI